jgi:peptidoglycan/xylan/chitin deacetylase (PgdA/CDA1 family)
MSFMLRRVLKAPLATKGAAQEAIRRYSGAGDERKGCSFLIYHRVDGGLPLELDLEPDLFRRQMVWLAARTRVLPYQEALAQLVYHAKQPIQAGRTAGQVPHQCSSSLVITFDDGYEDFYTRVFPILVEHGLPATLFVTTGFVEEGKPYPLLSRPSADVRPLTWEMLGEMAESELITLGAHTHSHPVLVGLPTDKVEEELVRPLELFERRLGMRPAHFAYPRAEASAPVRDLVCRHYASAVVGGGRPAQPAAFDRYRIPRIPIRRSDGWRFFRPKLRGWLADEEAVYAHLRTLTGRGTT